jgi:5-hydroxyisourate hydrolase-like protein (transthyretin family)
LQSVSSNNSDAWLSKSPKRSEEVLRAGTGIGDPVFDVKIYPNPYVMKATIDIDISKPSTIAVEVTDETGRIVGVLLPLKSLNVGLYRLEMPNNLSPGVYFVQCKSGEKTVVKKVVKTIGN